MEISEKKFLEGQNYTEFKSLFLKFWFIPLNKCKVRK